jgi:integrase
MATKITKTKSPNWISSMRTALRGQCGEGWSVRDIRGRIQLSVRFDDGARSTTVLDLPWAGTSQAPLLVIAAAAKPLVLDGKSLGEAVEVLVTGEASNIGKGPTKWAKVAEKFHAFKVSSGQLASERSWHRNYRAPIERALAVLAGKPTPTSGRGLLQKLVELHGGEPGSTGRRLRIQYVAQMLRYAVDDEGAEARWLPPTNLVPFIGVKPAGHVMATFIKDDQISRLLVGIANPEWRTAVGLLACFGLRPIELSTISANGEMLHCTYSKRTARKSEGTKPRDIIGLDPVGLPGLSANLLAVMAERGQEALPAACRGPRAGDALHQYLERQTIWRQLVVEVAETPTTSSTGNTLVPYSLRHAYAARASEVYGLTDRVAATFMGHAVQTHGSHYSATNTEMLAGALERTKAVAARQLQEAYSPSMGNPSATTIHSAL